MISKKTITRLMKPLTMLLVMVLLSKFGFSQDPGDNPDGPPPAVPFEDYMHLYLLAAGAILAFITIRKAQRKQVQN